MNDIAKEYASALYKGAYECGTEKEILDSLRLIRSVAEQYPKYISLLSSPAIPVGERIAMIEEAFGTSVEEYVLSFLCVLCKHKRFSCLVECIDAYEKLINRELKKQKIKITSAVPLTEEQRARVANKMRVVCGCDVEAEYFTDSSIKGGLIVESGDLRWDGSLKKRLQAICGGIKNEI